ncbi:hypothetical protein EfmE1162_2292, partial [Enterococcus faecium E1162]
KFSMENIKKMKKFLVKINYVISTLVVEQLSEKL